MGLRWFHIFGFAAVVVVLALGSLPQEREYGIALSRSGRPALAQEHLLAALARRPDDRTVVREVARMYTQMNRLQDAAHVLATFLHHKPGDLEIRLEAADLYLVGNNIEKAIRLLEVVPLPPVHQERLLALYQQAGQLDKAIVYLKKSMDGSAQDLSRWQRIGQFHTWRGEPQEAAMALEKVAAILGDETSWYELARAYEWLGNMEGLNRAVDQLERLPRVSRKGLQLVRMIRMRQRDLPATIRAMVRITTQPDAVAQDFLDLAQLHHWNQRPGDALVVLERGASRHPSHLQLLRQTMFWSHELGKTEAALTYARQIAELTATQADWRTLAQLLQDAGKSGEALLVLSAQAERPDAEANTFLLLAKFVLAADDKATAKTHVDRAIAIAGDNPVVWMEAATLYNRMGETDAEIATLNRASALMGSNAEAVFRLAQAYATTGRVAEARKLLEALARFPIDDPVAYRRDMAETRFLLALNAGDVDPALLQELRHDALQAVLAARKDGDTPELRGALIDLYLAMGRPEDAESLMGDMGKQSVDRILGLTEAYVALGQRERAIELTGLLQAVESLDAGKLGHLAYLHGKLENHALALRLLQLANKKTNGRDDAIYLALADAYGAVGSRDEQYRMLDSRAATGGVRAWLDAADRRQWNGDTAAEAVVLEKALRAHPDAVVLLARAAGAFARVGEVKKAEAYLSRLRDMGAEEDPVTLLALADALVSVKEFKDADAMYGRVLALAPANAAALAGRGYVKLARGQRLEAARLLGRYLELEPTDIEALFTLGEIQYDLGRSGAVPHRKVLHLLKTPGTARQWAVLARIQWRLGNKRVALRYMRNVFSLPSETSDPYLDMVDLLLGDELTDEAEAALESLAQKYSNDRRYRQLRAVAHIQREEFDQAKPILQELFALDPKNSDLLADLAYVEDMRRQYRTAMRLYRQAEDLRRRP